MRKIILASLVIAFTVSCSKKQVVSTSNQTTQNQEQAEVNAQSLVSRVNIKSEKAGIDETALLVLNGRIISRDDLVLLNELKVSEIKEVNALNKEVAPKIYGEAGKNGAVLLTSLIDETLNEKYYEGLTNELVLKTIEDLENKEVINSNPVLVLNGVPLRGQEIVEKINSLDEERIETISLLDKKRAYAIYGIRAMNGVLLITTK